MRFSFVFIYSFVQSGKSLLEWGLSASDIDHSGKSPTEVIDRPNSIIASIAFIVSFC